MKVVQSFCEAGNDVEPLRPREALSCLDVLIQSFGQTALGHELVDENVLAPVSTPSQQLDEISVAQLSQSRQLHVHLLLLLRVHIPKPLHRNHCSRRGQHSPVHVPCAVPELLLVAEPLSGHAQLLVSETLGPVQRCVAGVLALSPQNPKLPSFAQ
ncbi:hypothetical protein Mapa_000280 [Marchantia paleacea]|nr:hypothetical protein Mapa_000280 [Marchantia paleacea]